MKMFLFFVLVLQVVFLDDLSSATRMCEPIRIELCQQLGYNLTSMPNLNGNELQQEAEYMLKSFKPLIDFGCSAQLKLFLCSIHAPMCNEKVSNVPIGPCRTLCESVRERCYPVLQGFGFPWPDALDCKRFPAENNHVNMCMEGPNMRLHIDEQHPPASAIQCLEGYVLMPNDVCRQVCTADVLFDAADKKLAEVWVTLWALICLAASSATLLTLCVGGGRLSIQPLAALAACYCFVAAGWTIRVVAGRNGVSCLPHPGEDVAEEVIVQDASLNANRYCSMGFLFVYYFGMAANAWWVALCVWWYCKAAYNWHTERLRHLASTLHCFAWCMPALQTGLILLGHHIDADELTGACSVGNHNPTSLMHFAVLPQAGYLTIGLGVLVVGCWRLLQAPTQRTPTSRKDSDLLGALATCYAIPVGSVLACLCYEYAFLAANVADGVADAPLPTSRPLLWVHLVKHLMSLFIGVSTVFWLWSMKTLTAWKALFHRLVPAEQMIKSQQMPLQAAPLRRL